MDWRWRVMTRRMKMTSPEGREGRRRRRRRRRRGSRRRMMVVWEGLSETLSLGGR